MEINLSILNSHAIISFLNDHHDNNPDDWKFETLYFPLKFVKHEYNNDYYKLQFESYWSNWGQKVIASDNFLFIYNNGKIECCLDEAFEDGESYEIIENYIKLFLQNYDFNINVNFDDKYKEYIESVQTTLIDIYNLHPNNAEKIDTIIETLQKAKMYIK